MTTTALEPSQKAFTLEGDLDAADVARIYQRTRASCRSGNMPARIELGKVGQTDSSVLALLLEWKSQARQHDQSIEFDGPPENLRVLANLSQAAALLGWDKVQDSVRDGDQQ